MKGHIEHLKVNSIFSDSEFNPRGKLTPYDIAELARSIKQHGLMEPIIVKKHKEGNFEYKIIAGHRRHCAVKYLFEFENLPQFETIECKVIEPASELEERLLNITENISRKDLNILQEATVVNELKLKFDLSIPKICELLRVPDSWVNFRLKFHQLPKAIQEECIKANLPQQVIKKIFAGKTRQAQFNLFRLAVDEYIALNKRKLSLKENRNNKKNEKRQRKHTEVERLLVYLIETITPQLATRCLAWAIGNISTEELYDDIQQQCELEGKVFLRPKYDVSLRATEEDIRGFDNL